MYIHIYVHTYIYTYIHTSFVRERQRGKSDSERERDRPKISSAFGYTREHPAPVGIAAPSPTSFFPQAKDPNNMLQQRAMPLFCAFFGELGDRWSELSLCSR